MAAVVAIAFILNSLSYFAQVTNTQDGKIGGTSLNGFYFTVKILARSKIDPKYAPDLLRDGGSDLILSYLSAEHNTERELAHGFLVQISGMDLGYDEVKWADWIKKITKSSEIREESEIPFDFDHNQIILEVDNKDR